MSVCRLKFCMNLTCKVEPDRSKHAPTNSTKHDFDRVSIDWPFNNFYKSCFVSASKLPVVTLVHNDWSKTLTRCEMKETILSVGCS